MVKIKPAEMTRISVTGSKNCMEKVIEELYRLEVLDIDNYEGELDLEKGSPFEEAESISQFLVDVRSLISKLPETESTRERKLNISEVQDKVPEITEKIEDINSNISELERKISSIKDQRKFFGRLRGTGLTYEDLQGTETLEVFIGNLDVEAFKRSAPSDSYELLEGESAQVLYYPEYEKEEFEKAISDARNEEYTLVETQLAGKIEAVLEHLDSRKEELRQQKKQLEEDLEQFSVKWRGTLQETEEFLTERVEKAEAPINFATTDNAFIAKGWIPDKKYYEVEERLADVTDGRVHVQREEGENPPVKHENNRFVKPFESLTDLVATPKYNELDPSFVIMLTFPLFFGFMIGDAGYGLTTLAVFYGGYRMFPQAKAIFKSLMYASIATIAFGLAFGDAFGYIIFGEESVLAAQFGLELFRHIPVLYHRAHHLGQVFVISAIIGLVHVNLGYLLGFYNEYVNHGFKEAFLEKGSWMLLEAAAALWYFVGMTAGAPVAAIAVALLYLGEGIEGIVEIPSLMSNVLSYLRIFGVSVAAVSLAAVVNGLADPLFRSGGIIGIGLGLFLLVFGHTFNTFIKIMEGFLQGIRLHYVEMFGKFFEGGGREYAPFGARELN